MTEMIEQARAILRRNDRGGYTVPTDRLYPFQWNWDSAFVAMGWATFDEARGFTEVERLLEGQWDDGLVPQIVFHAPSDDYFPGPSVWGMQHAPPTSGITQPPVSGERRAADAGSGARRCGGGGRGWRRSTRGWSPRIAGGSRRAIRQAAGWCRRCIPGRRAWTTVLPGTWRWRACRRRRPRRCSGATRRTWMRRCGRARRSISASSIWWMCSATRAGSRTRCWRRRRSALRISRPTPSCCVPSVTCWCWRGGLAGRATRRRSRVARTACRTRSGVCGMRAAGLFRSLDQISGVSDRGRDIGGAAAALCRCGGRGAHSGDGRDVAALGWDGALSGAVDRAG